MYVLLSAAYQKPVEAYLYNLYTFHPSTLQTDREEDICLPWDDTFLREQCFVKGERLQTQNTY